MSESAILFLFRIVLQSHSSTSGTTGIYLIPDSVLESSFDFGVVLLLPGSESESNEYFRLRGVSTRLEMSVISASVLFEADSLEESINNDSINVKSKIIKYYNLDY